MSLIRRVARPMLATMFVVGGLDQLRHPAKQAAKAGKPSGEFQAEVRAEPNVLDFDVKGKTAKP